MDWLIPLALFWLVTALYLGGFPVEVVGGNAVRQVIGLVDSYIIYVVVWAVLRMALSGMGDIFWGMIIPTIVTTLALPLITRAGFIIMGVRVQAGSRPH